MDKYQESFLVAIEKSDNAICRSAAAPLSLAWSDLDKATKRIKELEAKLRELCSVSESVFSDDIVDWVENNIDEIKQLLDDK